MRWCPKCLRHHTGPCGIPPRSTMRSIGSGLGATSQTTHPLQGKPPKPKLSVAILEGLLAQGKEQYEKVTSLLKELPQSMEECKGLLDREGKLFYLLKQLGIQIAARK